MIGSWGSPTVTNVTACKRHDRRDDRPAVLTRSCDYYACTMRLFHADSATIPGWQRPRSAVEYESGSCRHEVFGVQASPELTTLLFTDIEGSTRLWERESDKMSRALAEHDALSRTAVERNHGTVVKMKGDG